MLVLGVGVVIMVFSCDGGGAGGGVMVFCGGLMVGWC